MSDQSSEKRCPICGRGVLRHLGAEAGQEIQRADSVIRETYTCGHEVVEEQLASADQEKLEVERRQSPETTVDPD